MSTKETSPRFGLENLGIHYKKIEIALVLIIIGAIVGTSLYFTITTSELDDHKPAVTESELKQAFERYQRDTDDTYQQRDVILKYYQFQFDPVTNGEFRYEDFSDQIGRDVFLWSLEQSEIDFLKEQAKNMFP